jgi:hypothetical protein
VVLAGVRCSAPQPAVVSAPIVLAASAPVGARVLATPPGEGALAACSRPWNLEEAEGGPGRVVVVCGNDVRREPFDPSGSMIRAISPALEPARQRVCNCAAHLQAPAYVDLVVTTVPSEGRAKIEASDPEDDELGPPFVSCVGHVVATFPPARPEACSDHGKVVFVYPFRVELRDSPVSP